MNVSLERLNAMRSTLAVAGAALKALDDQLIAFIAELEDERPDMAAFEQKLAGVSTTIETMGQKVDDDNGA